MKRPDSGISLGESCGVRQTPLSSWGRCRACFPLTSSPGREALKTPPARRVPYVPFVAGRTQGLELTHKRSCRTG